MKPQVAVIGGFDNLASRQIRFLEEASHLGEVTVLLWSDEITRQVNGALPKFPEAERFYLLQAIRYVSWVKIINQLPNRDALPDVPDFRPDVWATQGPPDQPAKLAFCQARGVRYHKVPERNLSAFPEVAAPENLPPSGRKKVLVTGCYDWFHSGHVRFFEEVSALGDLYVVVGHDANIRLLKGEGHPLLPQEERRYAVGSVRFVRQALVSTGHGWLDAQPEIQRLRPDIYAVNEEGDRGGKREFCARAGIEYRVLKRTPAPGLPKRSSTELRGF